MKVSQNSQEVTCARVSFLIKLLAWQSCFPVNFVKFLRTPFLQNTSGRLLLNVCYLLLFQTSSRHATFYEANMSFFTAEFPQLSNIQLLLLHLRWTRDLHSILDIVMLTYEIWFLCFLGSSIRCLHLSLIYEFCNLPPTQIIFIFVKKWIQLKYIVSFMQNFATFGFSFSTL